MGQTETMAELEGFPRVYTRPRARVRAEQPGGRVSGTSGSTWAPDGSLMTSSVGENQDQLGVRVLLAFVAPSWRKKYRKRPRQGYESSFSLLNWAQGSNRRV